MSDVPCVVFDSIKDARFATVEPRKSDEKGGKARERGNAALMNRRPLRVQDGQVDPAKISLKTCGPDHPASRLPAQI